MLASVFVYLQKRLKALIFFKPAGESEAMRLAGANFGNCLALEVRG